MDEHLHLDERLRSEFNAWARAGRGEGMEKGHRPIGEQAIELMGFPRTHESSTLVAGPDGPHG